MGLATSTQTEWGYYVTGDTDPTTIWTDGRKYIQAIVYCPGTTNDTVVISTSKQITGAYTNLWTSASAGTAGVAQEVRFDGNIPADNLKIAISNSSAKVYIYLRSR